jgi:hypothetical protein
VQGLSRGSGTTPWFVARILAPDWGAGTHDEKSPVVTLALLANHRLTFLHPFGVTEAWAEARAYT